jgi:hypothetical protein
MHVLGGIVVAQHVGGQGELGRARTRIAPIEIVTVTAQIETRIERAGRLSVLVDSDERLGGSAQLAGQSVSGVGFGWLECLGAKMFCRVAWLDVAVAVVI